jgi:hypothetical protein
MLGIHLTVDGITSIVTSIGVVFAGWQLWLTQRQATTQFEDNLNAQYREIIKEIPIQALLGDPLNAKQQEEALEHFYHYFDLSNEQAFLRRKRRIRRETRNDWAEGITQNLSKPAFASAWRKITSRSQSFSDVRQLVPMARELAAAAVTHVTAAKTP